MSEEALDISTYHLYSAGIVVRGKLPGSSEVLIYPYEKLPFYEGTLSPDIAQSARSGIDKAGRAYTVNLDLSLAVSAYWEAQTNRSTAPDVVDGERVWLYTVGNTERYYWRPMGKDDQLRRSEVVVYSWMASGAPSSTDVKKTVKNSWTVIIDTRNGHMTVRTSKDRNEKCTYTLQLNPKGGNSTWMDDKGNVIQMDSDQTRITMLNADGTLVRLDKRDLYISAEDNINMSATDITADAGNGFYVKAQEVSVAAQDVLIGSPTTTVTGNLRVDGVIDAGVDVTSNGVSLVSHTEIGNLGAPTSVPIPTGV